MDVVPQLETCRICANCYVSNDEADFIQFFQAQEGIQRELDFVLKEIKCWELNIIPNDGLPQQMCINCFQKFCAIETFRQECVDAQNLLHKSKLLDESQLLNHKSQALNHQQEFLIAEPLSVTETDTALQRNESHEVCFDILNTDAVFEKPCNEELSSNVPLCEKVIAEKVDNTAIPEVCFDVLNGNSKFENYLNNLEGTRQYSTDVPLCDEVIAQEADTTQSSIDENVTKNNEDLEEMLESCVIPKNLTENTKNLPAKQDVEEKISQRIANFRYACNYCYCPKNGPIEHIIFNTNDELSQHFFDVHDPKLPYPCPNCPQLFDSMRKRNSHVNNLHGDSRKKKICPYCKKIRRTKQEIHEKRCDFISNWRCYVCNKEFNQMPLRSFRSHERSHDLGWKYRCNICKRVFLLRHNFMAHKHKHEGEIKNVHSNKCECIECNEVFNSSFELKRHEFKVHKGKAVFRCKYCSKGYINMAFLKRHVKNAHITETSRFGQDETTCPKCNATFQSKLKLHFHMQRKKAENGQCIPISRASKKSRQKSFACTKCSKRFNLKEQLELHAEVHDVRLRPYACNKCSVRCRTDFDLKQHTYFAHLNVCAFQCNVENCGKQFAYNKDLEIHKIYHAELKFQCKFKDCPTICKNESALAEHMRSHDPVSCEFCGKLFLPNEIEDHVKSSHNIDKNLEINSNNQMNFTKTISNLDFINDNFENLNFINTSFKETLSNAEVCSDFFEPSHSTLLDEGMTIEGHDFLALGNDTICNNIDFNMVDVPLSVNDSYIGSLLDLDFENIVN